VVVKVLSGRACQMLPATSSTRLLNPRFLIRLASYDVASNIWQEGLPDVARHVIDTHVEPCFLELNGIL